MIKLFITSVALAFLLVACTPRTIVVTQEVKIPVRCDTQMPINKSQFTTFSGTKIDASGNLTKEYLNYITDKVIKTKNYINELELKLQYCIGVLSNEN